MVNDLTPVQAGRGRRWSVQAGFIAVLATCLLGMGAVEGRSDSGLARLSGFDVTRRLDALPGWTVEDQHLICTYQFDNFVEAIAFVNQLVGPAEALGHHPDLMISYDHVTIRLTTHDVGGLTDLDFRLAQTIAQLREALPSETLGCL